jgi:hypothetical protein
MEISAVRRLKHCGLWHAAEKLGGQAALAEYLMVHRSDLSQWINLKSLPPVTVDDIAGRPAWTVERLAEFERKLLGLTGKTLVELFPESMRACRKFFNQKKEFGLTRDIHEEQLRVYFEQVLQRRQQIGPYEYVEQSEVCELVQRVLSTLPEREQRILSQLYGIGGTAPKDGYEIAYEEGCTLENVRHIEKLALCRLRKLSRSKALLDYSA